MDVEADMTVEAPVSDVYPWIDDLTHYPSWLDITSKVRPDGEAAWLVDLRGSLGPLSRVKRLRMIRTEHDATRVVFERSETDGRDHSPWVLTATVTETPSGARLQMTMHYGGSLWGPVLERLLGDAINESRERLAQCVASGPPG